MNSCPPINIHNPEHGFLEIGEETDAKVLRKHHVQLGGGTGAALHIYKDGGWCLWAKNNELGSSLIQEGSGPISITSDGDINLEAKGDISMKARNIIMQTTASDGDVVINSKHNIRLDADNNVTILGTNVTTKAFYNMLQVSDGWNIISGNPIFLHEQKTKLIPTSVADIVNTLLGEIIVGA